MLAFLDVVLPYVYVVSVVALIWSHRRLLRSAVSAGYWRGRGDESVLGVYRAIVDREVSVEEVKQVVAQQAEKTGVELPEEWPSWDGIDRLALNLPPDFLSEWLDQAGPLPIAKPRRKRR